MKSFKISLMLLSMFAAFAGSAMAAPSNEIQKDIQVEVNNSEVKTDTHPYIKNGSAIVPLNVVQQIPGVSITWDNASKTITITRDHDTVKLVAGQKTATVGGKQVALSAPSSIEKGRVMVPLRFIAESSNAGVVWNAKTRTVSIAKANEALIHKYKSKKLSESRTAALAYPRLSLLKEPDVKNESQSQEYLFVSGKSDQFFILGGNGIYYYKIVGNYAQKLWTARSGHEGKSGLFFYPFNLIEQDGVKPIINSKITFYYYMGTIGAASYGFITPDGKRTELGQKDMDFNQFFEIPEEK
ncbi:copper amine oxidase N-terminal domain-containing protein [Paenibacillus sp. JX-17]|uniref:Copper amine oxidase N-terminal domain-containing protein n=1 Tax=Paenibacillus lacisoli TaxID=3064525 RepID=A0ABT9C9S9_9BACL|nr:copper amine oxidase N-terminal domain-containing protein [Paenibacillus sp. JX-17]MDO7905635.1 copper amine oxidase N-terminal domain-containing protein [Paenibacillus sp. JX-17]